MAKRATRIYISAMETKVYGLPHFDPQASDLLAKLIDAGYAVYWQKKFLGYEVIERDIASSDALLAIVDSTWRSSTWMASEVTWANRGFEAIETPHPKIKPIPVFLYPVVYIKEKFPFNEINVVLLERDVDQARNQILTLLSPHCAAY